MRLFLFFPSSQCPQIDTDQLTHIWIETNLESGHLISEFSETSAAILSSCTHTVHGPEDAVVSEMIKQLPLEKIYTITRCFQERFMHQMEAPSSWKIVKLVFLRKPDAESKKGIRSNRAIALTSVTSK